VFAATPEEVKTAIARGQEFLLNTQTNGNWEPPTDPAKKGDNPDLGGYTAIATYALLASGVSPQDPKVKSGIDYLVKLNDMTGIYAIGIRAQIWHLLPRKPEYLAAAKRDAQLLIEGVGKKAPNTGMYHYTIAPNGNFHHSPAQYGVLGMWACDQAGIEVSQQYWQAVQDAWRKNQQPDGGWSYKFKPDPGHPVTAAMTTAGVATLFITQDYLSLNNGVNCKPPLANAWIDKGMRWMEQNFSTIGKGDMYTWYGVERIGVASGYKFFGSSDWYQLGADIVVKQQNKNNGSWNYRGGNVGTSYALLFLSRGSAPVVMNKLQYSTETAKAVPTNPQKQTTVISSADNVWNTRPRDAANVVRWMGKEIEHDLNWQITDLAGRPEDMLDAPILYVAGSKPPVFTTDERDKLKRYAELGGLIFGHADCASASFATAFRKLGTDLFPGYEWRELPDNHPIYTRQQFLRTTWKVKPRLVGLSNGSRELMLLLPQGDAGAAWQTLAAARKPELFQLMSSIFQYTIDKANYRRKGETWVLAPDPKIKPTRSIKMARLQYAGNWDPEPAGWARLATSMANVDKVTLDVQKVELGKGALKPADFPLAHLTFVEKPRLSEMQWKELGAYVNAGGRVLVDVTGGEPNAALDVENELIKLAPDKAAQFQTPIPLDDSFYATASPKIPITYRPYAQKIAGVKSEPRLRRIVTDANGQIFFSPDDLSSGLVGMPTDGIVGYTPATSLELARRIVLAPAPK